MDLLEALLNRVSAWSTPILLSLAVYFAQKFITGVDEELKKLRNSASKTTIDLINHNAEIKIHLNALSESIKTISEKMIGVAKELEDVDKRLILHKEFHAQILRAHEGYSRALQKNHNDIETLLHRVGNLTFIREKKK